MVGGMSAFLAVIFPIIALVLGGALFICAGALFVLWAMRPRAWKDLT
jgi:hypothetical protein